jgi:hypothetical protein
MDVVAQGPWAVVMGRWRGRCQPIARSTTTGTIGLAVAPDFVQLTPIVTAALITPQGWSAMQSYFHALPSSQPVLPPQVELIAQRSWKTWPTPQPMNCTYSLACWCCEASVACPSM